MPTAEEQPEYSQPGVRGRPFPPGRSGNPSGRPKGTASLRAGIRRCLSREDCEQIGQRLIKQSKQGDVVSLKLLAQLLGEFPPTGSPNVALAFSQQQQPPPDDDPGPPKLSNARLREILAALDAEPPPDVGGSQTER